jgi:hypothetical protein
MRPFCACRLHTVLDAVKYRNIIIFQMTCSLALTIALEILPDRSSSAMSSMSTCDVGIFGSNRDPSPVSCQVVRAGSSPQKAGLLVLNWSLTLAEARAADSSGIYLFQIPSTDSSRVYLSQPPSTSPHRQHLPIPLSFV